MVNVLNYSAPHALRLDFRGAAKFAVAALALTSLPLFLSGCGDRDSPELSQLQLSVGKLEQRIASLEAQQRKRAMLHSPVSSEPSPVSPAVVTDDDALKDDPFLGQAAAPVVVVLFSNYQCQPCRAFYTQTLPRLKQEFIDKGTVKLIFSDFPLASNPYGVLAANTAQCAGEQGSYWQMHDLLFEHGEALDGGDIDSIVALATKIDKKRLMSCVASSRYNREIEADITAGKEVGMKGAPGFFLGRKTSGGTMEGIFIRGAQPFEYLAEVLRSLIAVVPDDPR